MRTLALVVATVGALAAASPAAAGQVERDAKAAKQGLARAAAAGRLAPESWARHRAAVDRAVGVWRKLSGARAANLAGALHDAAILAPRYDEPRALAIFAGLEVNTDYFGTRAAPARTVDVQDEDGVVYRLFAPRGLQFHPLATFGKLNAYAVRNDVEATARLADALLERAVRTRAGLTWEYYFPFGGGAAPWTSGMAQAVGAQAFARAAGALADPTLLEPATQAYRASAALVRATSAGPWIRLYSFSSMLVLNAQLQAALSIGEYAKASGNPDAAVFATRLEQATAALLPRFDTGAWSLYALGGAEAEVKYHSYVVSLLERLAQRTQSPAWADAAARFDSYLALPPDVVPRGATTTVYPLPRDGFLDRATVTFSLSKKSTVRFVVAGERRPFTLPRGRHTLTWNPGSRPPRRYAAMLVATDLAGNTTELPLESIEVRRDTEPPAVAAVVDGRTLAWDVLDEGTPWLRLTVVLERAGKRVRVDLGQRPLRGSQRLTATGLPVELTVVDSAGNSTTVAL